MMSIETIQNNHPSGPGIPGSLQLVIMCYDRVIRDLEEARKLHHTLPSSVAHEKVQHAQDIITELLLGLDYERGGDIAQNLSRIYNFMLRQMIGINNRQDTLTYDHLIHLMSELKSSWEEIASQSR